MKLWSFDTRGQGPTAALEEKASELGGSIILTVLARRPQ
jgi:hypothetical protein